MRPTLVLPKEMPIQEIVQQLLHSVIYYFATQFMTMNCLKMVFE